MAINHSMYVADDDNMIAIVIMHQAVTLSGNVLYMNYVLESS